MRLFNSLTGKIEEVTPLLAGKIGMYSCGPTVYNFLHIGNLSAFIYADVLRRTLELSGYDVHHVMNITDVDDKTIRDSKRDYPDDDPKTALKKLTDTYTDVFMEDLSATGNNVENIQFISAVDTIPEMVHLTQRIIDAGFGYITDDGVYFSIKAYTDAGHPYGLLQKVSVASAKSRVANDEYDKDNASDFALWKATSEGEPAWDATFVFDGKTVQMPGRPGWHIECSAMSEKLLGVPFDIHTGGIDLKFPHHENEIAQTCASGANNLATYFVHNNHILVDGRKMSKSLGNFYTLRDIEKKGYSASAFRLLVLESHYSSESNFTFEILDAATNRIANWRAIADRRWQDTTDVSFAVNTSDILNLMQDNLDTPRAIARIDALFTELEKTPNASAIEELCTYIEQLLGIGLLAEDAPDAVKNLLAKRAQARSAKDWDASDDIRSRIEALHYGVRDSAEGQIWFRK